jgi:hypothetical protein
MAVDSVHTVHLNVTSKLNPILSLPSRFLARIRLFDELFNHDLGRNEAITTANEWGTAADALASSPPRPPNLTPFPGPWGFLTSGYALVLFTMVSGSTESDIITRSLDPDHDIQAVILHRIQNIVVPPQRPFAYHMARHHRQRHTLWRLIYHAVLPLDFSSTWSRLAFYLPSLYLLAKALLLWTIILLQTSSLFPPYSWSWLRDAGDWASSMPMEDVCWKTFCAVCIASCVETLVRGLEGSGTSGNLSPFNLVRVFPLLSTNH